MPETRFSCSAVWEKAPDTALNLDVTNTLCQVGGGGVLTACIPGRLYCTTSRSRRTISGPVLLTAVTFKLKRLVINAK